MKKLTHLLLTLSSFVLLLVASAAQAQDVYNPIGKVETGGTCHIALTAQCRRSPRLPIKKWFKDSYFSAHMNAANCIARAQQYKNWCQNAPANERTVDKIQVRTQFRSHNGISLIGAHTTKDNRVRLTNGRGQFMRFISF